MRPGETSPSRKIKGTPWRVYMGKPFQAEELACGAKTSLCVCVNHSVISDSVIPWTVACQVPLSMEFSRPEYWSGLPFPPPGDLSHPRIQPGSPTLQADYFPLSHKALKSVLPEHREFEVQGRRGAGNELSSGAWVPV